MNSKIHRGKSVECPFCKASFGTASCACTHLESSSCPKAPKLNRETILQIIRRHDTAGHIANNQIEWHNEARGTYTVTRNAYNGSSWECYLCHKRFSGRRCITALIAGNAVESSSHWQPCLDTLRVNRVNLCASKAFRKISMGLFQGRSYFREKRPILRVQSTS
ncbi:hypothetical protein N7509_011861 [Penicillium cosmopolitanum]|uniref:Uncharacterized protein n=1 Tax=Penicillium cosmopolitanum TaxID=1131564 RepID=A0A9W9SHK3_9EURO|nr:uncharacterized protein N7509_011861 [Penicillium cosmopolitanum]KAJ5378742.1 hypothetical protein N7509_011861 [Penicillium cosmopolitanum]